MNEAKLLVDITDHVAHPVVIDTILGQLRDARAEVPVGGVAVRVKNHTWVCVLLDHAH